MWFETAGPRSRGGRVVQQEAVEKAGKEKETTSWGGREKRSGPEVRGEKRIGITGHCRVAGE